MNELTMAQQLAQAAIAFEKQRTGHAAESVTVVMSQNVLVITLCGSLSPAELAVVQDPARAEQLREFHRQLFASSSTPLREEIKRITGMDVREAAADTARGATTSAFTEGTTVQVFLLAGPVPSDTWSEASRNGDRDTD